METSRLRIRLVGADDIEFIVRVWTDPDVTQHIGGPREADGIREYFSEVAADPAVILSTSGDRWWLVCLRTSGEWIGL